ncbi:MAG: DUF1254 domain-containing protein, partial [Acidobacteria bacterium]|nr:DUF1254 domain-containing protein [Acidobacteriota bacterium]
MSDASFAPLNEALVFAAAHIAADPDPCNDRERADGELHVLRMLAAVTQSATLRLDPDRPSFLTMAEAVRFVGAAGPDIDYDVAAVRPGVTHRITGVRGDATFVGIAVYAGSGAAGASAIVESADIDTIVDADGRFVWEFSHPEAARVIIRQYFHDRQAQVAGSWTIERVDAEPVVGAAALPSAVEMEQRVAAAAASLRWNASLNTLWTPQQRDLPNAFVRQTSDDIVAAIPNPDVIYSFTWWRLAAQEALVIEFTPPTCAYWSVQMCDRWYQCFPDRRSALNDRQVVVDPDGSVRILLADGDPGEPNWLDTGGHRVGIIFFRWLHADPDQQPTCRVL